MKYDNAKERAEFRKQPVWQLFRRWMLSNRDQTCEFCGKRYKDISHLNIHHKFETNYDNLDVNRFMVVCKTCHEFIHAKYNTPVFKDRGFYGLKDCDGYRDIAVRCNH